MNGFCVLPADELLQNIEADLIVEIEFHDGLLEGLVVLDLLQVFSERLRDDLSPILMHDFGCYVSLLNEARWKAEVHSARSHIMATCVLGIHR